MPNIFYDCGVPGMRAAAVAASVLLLAACGGGNTVKAGSAGELVLEPKDLPAGFAQFDVGPTATLDTQGTLRSDPARWGREGGWKARYRQADGTTDGPLVIDCRADVFKSASGAKTDLQAYAEDFGRTLRSGDGRRLALPKLGDAAVAVTTLRPGTPGVRTYMIAWRDRNVSASLSVNGFDRKLTLGSVLRLAQRQERRISGA